MSQIKLSYVITTRNKLPYLREVMQRLLENVQADEEIVVADGASTDGTVDYLKDLYEQGKIHQFISEPDKGEAHGYNKCLLMARGELIKIITDDDVFYYPGIQECKQFMLAHPDIDVLGTQGASGGGCLSPQEFTQYLDRYKAWKETVRAFDFSGLGLMIRRSSIPLTGLFNTNFLWVDCEFTYRITSRHVNLAWFTGLCWVHCGNLQSNSRQWKRMRLDMDRLDKFYGISKQPIKRVQERIFTLKVDTVNLLKKVQFLDKLKEQVRPERVIPQIEDVHAFNYQWLEEKSIQRKSHFLH
ncbi:glycosyltransferase [Pantanalinema rosaneae CENA516]|uniref:glycosyltransferase n=1 Tax=Pantanalinema rosaneae TaxID=1620701 RepID=UPI003D6F3B0A